MTEAKTIYHYCRLNTALEHILPSRKLRFNLLSKTNDPRENKSFVFATQSWGPIPNQEEKNEEVSRMLRKDCKVICFSRDRKFFGFESSRMWAYYGDNHKGFCLAFDKDEFIAENNRWIDANLLRDVEYFEFNYSHIEHKIIDFTVADEVGLEHYLKNVFRPNHMHYLYFTKNKEWDTENEVRLVHFSGRNEDEFCSIRKSLRRIYCGVDFHTSYLPSLVRLCPDVEIALLEYGDVRLTAKLIYSGGQKYIHPEFRYLFENTGLLDH